MPHHCRMPIEIAPANQASCAELTTIFGARGNAADRQCQRYRLAPGEAFGNTRSRPGSPPCATRARAATRESPGTSGLIARLAGCAGGWCAVAPRTAYVGLVRNSNQTAWRGQRRRPHRQRRLGGDLHPDPSRRTWSGASPALAAARWTSAPRARGPAAEAYLITVPDATWRGTSRAAERLPRGRVRGVHRPSKRRAVVSITL